MSREIYTYTDLTKLKENKLYQEIMRCPQITVSADLKDGLYGTVTEFHSFAKALNKDWETDQSKFNQMLLLSEYIRQRMKTERMKTAPGRKKEINWLLGCMRNISSLLSSIILLEQADVRPEHIKPDGERNLELMVDAWKYLAEREPSIKAFRENMNREYKKSDWEEVFRTAFETDEHIEKTDAVVFHGFYYITPLQEKIMRLLEQAGYKLIYLFPYDERYPFVYEIWDTTYSEKNGYPPKEKWHMEKSNEADPYGDIFEGKEHVSVNNKISFREYASMMEFVDDVKSVREQGYSIYSSDFKAANNVLKDFYPEEYGERKILAYPVGQFVSILNRMWDDELREIVLDEDSLIECFSSGWLSVNGTSSRQYLQDLTYLLPFLAGCHTRNDWCKRIELLKEIRRDAVEPFLEDLDADKSISRWQEAIGNPMANFSMFAVEAGRLEDSLSLIKQLLDMAKDLFGEDQDQEIRVSDHIRKLERILKNNRISDEMYEEERVLVDDIFKELGQLSDLDTKCAPADIANALNFFICGEFEDDEIQTNKLGLVYPMYFVDAACVKNESKVHVCMCDVDSMPGGNKEYVWPLSSSIIKECYRNTKNPLLVDLMQIMESTCLCNRYFMYCALKNKDVTVSWVSSVGEKLLAPSSYIKLVCDAAGMEPAPTKRSEITFAHVVRTGYGHGRIAEYDNTAIKSGMVKEASMAYALCPTKYAMGYVVEKYPTYQSEFQQSYALKSFISAIYDLMMDQGDKQAKEDQVYKNVMELFPGLHKIEKREVYDHISSDHRENLEDDMDYGCRTKCGDYYYTDERLRIHYPNRQVREVAKGRFAKLMTPDGRNGMDLYAAMEPTEEEKVKKLDVSAVCMYCPHADYCRNAIYYVDREN